MLTMKPDKPWINARHDWLELLTATASLVQRPIFRADVDLMRRSARWLEQNRKSEIENTVANDDTTATKPDRPGFQQLP
jgi:hypothetical protein